MRISTLRPGAASRFSTAASSASWSSCGSASRDEITPLPDAHPWVSVWERDSESDLLKHRLQGVLQLVPPRRDVVLVSILKCFHFVVQSLIVEAADFDVTIRECRK